MTHMRSSLARLLPRQDTPAPDLESLRADAWHAQGVICVRLEDVADEWLRAGLGAWARMRWGARRGERR